MSKPAPRRTLFAWDQLIREPAMLPGFFLLSIAAHLATFFLFQISYPERVSIPAPAPEVSLLLPTSPENRSLLRRIAAEDPALAARASDLTPPGLAEVKYHPSFETIRTQPRMVSEAPAEVAPPSPRQPMAIIQSSVPRPSASGAAPPPQPTRVSFSASLHDRAPKAGWGLKARTETPLEPATFMVGVTSHGEVRFVFQQHSSGDPAMDQAAAAELPRLEFEKAEVPIAWGMATITWGDDAYEPSASPQ